MLVLKSPTFMISFHKLVIRWPTILPTFSKRANFLISIDNFDCKGNMSENTRSILCCILWYNTCIWGSCGSSMPSRVSQMQSTSAVLWSCFASIFPARQTPCNGVLTWRDWRKHGKKEQHAQCWTWSTEDWTWHGNPANKPAALRSGLYFRTSG